MFISTGFTEKSLGLFPGLFCFLNSFVYLFHTSGEAEKDQRVEKDAYQNS